MRARDISCSCAPLDKIMQRINELGQGTSIGVGDGGNELGECWALCPEYRYGGQGRSSFSSLFLIGCIRMCTHTCIIYVYIHTHIHTHIHAHIRTHARMHTHSRTHAHVFVCIHLSLSLCPAHTHTRGYPPKLQPMPIHDVCVCFGHQPSGMGKVIDRVQEHISNGKTIACATASDILVCAGVSNWCVFLQVVRFVKLFPFLTFSCVVIVKGWKCHWSLSVSSSCAR